ncbi:hypothetical protein G5V57_02885 [Nordella sp. HKS 07]|nr:hypothetical protein [Nordella sp. HKS 07]QIG46788.1 hypothetical protein G5V57_02885 [Nordella sp. HKS 07]
MISKEFLLRMHGYGLTTAEIHYHLPDYPGLLQLFLWSHHDLAPEFPTLMGFLSYWEREIEGKLHSVRMLITHSWSRQSGVISARRSPSREYASFRLSSEKTSRPQPSCCRLRTDRGEPEATAAPIPATGRWRPAKSPRSRAPKARSMTRDPNLMECKKRDHPDHRDGHT